MPGPHNGHVPELPPNSREARGAHARLGPAEQPAGLLRTAPRWKLVIAGALGAAILVAAVAIGIGASRSASSHSADGAKTASDVSGDDSIPLATALPVPQMQQGRTAAPSCDDPEILAALDGGTDADVIAAFGGGEAFRAAVASDDASCVSLTEVGRIWIVVNKLNGIEVEGYLPELIRADAARNPLRGELRADTNAALAQLAQASIDEGAGEIGIASSTRADWSQRRLYERELASNGRTVADAGVARAGHSEHQTGLAVDIVACSSGCGTIEAFGDTAQGRWVAENAWRFGFIVRYEDGYTPVTGYMAEPWHLRYIGTELAAAYNEGGYHTLEDFFGLPPAPDYAD